ncbi:hypothetical protein DXB77_08060 [Clostridium sp. OM05-9]|jgi:hypothetical protein|nr:hypothetical protein DXB77_08060 [Clostridium sp. OM05-9]
MVVKNDFYFCIICILFFFSEIVGDISFIINRYCDFTMGSKKDNIWVIVFLLLLFQKALQRLTTGIAYQGITYMDEIVEILLLVMLIYVSIHKFSLDRANKRILITFLRRGCGQNSGLL